LRNGVATARPFSRRVAGCLPDPPGARSTGYNARGTRPFVVQQLEQAILRLAPTQALQQFAAELICLRRGGEGLEQGEQVRIVRIFRFAGARESVTIREIASFISLALLNSGMVFVVALRHLRPSRPGSVATLSSISASGR